MLRSKIIQIIFKICKKSNRKKKKITELNLQLNKYWRMKVKKQELKKNKNKIKTLSKLKRISYTQVNLSNLQHVKS